MQVLAAMSGGNPSAVTTALIALGGALVGGLVTAGGQVAAERSRAKHESELEGDRAKRADEARQRNERAAARASARSLIEDFVALRTRCHVALDDGRWWASEFTPRPRTTSEDHRILAAHLDYHGWAAVAQAQSHLETLDTIRTVRDDMRPLTDANRSHIEHAVALIDKAQDVLVPLARDD